jgi:hypothetical protein
MKESQISRARYLFSLDTVRDEPALRLREHEIRAGLLQGNTAISSSMFERIFFSFPTLSTLAPSFLACTKDNHTILATMKLFCVG